MRVYVSLNVEFKQPDIEKTNTETQAVNLKS